MNKPNRYERVKTALLPFKDILWFLILFIGLSILWKLAIYEGEHHERFVVFGCDLTKTVEPVSSWTATACYWIIHDLFGYDNYFREGNSLFFDEGFRLIIIWGCTGVKQIVLFSIMMMCYYGPLRKKYVFIPLSMLILNLLNIVRIVATAFIVKDGYPDWFIGFNEWFNGRQWVDMQQSYNIFMYDWFQMFHENIFRWLYYDGVMFLLWLYWQERINLPFQRKRNKEKMHEAGYTEDIEQAVPEPE